MASEILGLFASPELYQQQRDQAMREQAANYAALNPYQRVSYNAAMAGQRAGQALSSLLGVQDPQLQIITARQNVMRSVDPADPQSIAKAAEMLMRAGDQQGALTLADYARKASSEMALATQRTTEKVPEKLQAAARVNELTLAREEFLAQNPNMANSPQVKALDAEIASLSRAVRAGQVPDSIEISRELALEAGPEGSDAYNKAYRENLRKLTTEKSNEKQLEFSRILQEAGYAVGTPEYKSKMLAYANSEITGKAKGKGTEITNVLPGQGKEGAKDIPAFRDKVIKTIDPFRKTVTAADSAISNISDSIKTSNFASFRAAQTQFARAISGAGDLSREELKAAGADPSLIGGTADYLSTLFTSTPTDDTQKKLLSTLRAIRTVAAKKAKEELSNQKKIATRAGFTEDDSALIFNFPEFEQGKAGGGAGKSRTITLKSGKVLTVEQE